MTYCQHPLLSQFLYSRCLAAALSATWCAVLADEKSAEIAGCTNEISQLENLLVEVEAKRARLTAELDALIGRPARTSGDVSSTPSPDQYKLAMKKARLTLTRTIGTQTEPAKSQTEPEQ